MADDNEAHILTTPIHGDRQPTDGKSGDAPEPRMLHEAGERSHLLVEEHSGVAAAEATGKLRPDNEESPEETAGSG